jgi:hypothetical protein
MIDGAFGVRGMVGLQRLYPVRIASLAFLATACGGAWAGPPYATDDPVPTDKGHWEIYTFASALRAEGATSGEVGLDLNYGAVKDLQLTLVLPAAYEQFHGLHAGVGAVEIAAKYRFMHQSDDGWRPDIAFFPRIFAPTAKREFGTRHTNLLLPLWLGKDVGKWSVFGGGGYDINPGAGNRDYWTGGLGISRAIGDKASLGIEIYSRSSDAVGGASFAGVNVGATYKLVEHWSLLASFGPGIRNAASEGRYSSYFALKADY